MISNKFGVADMTNINDPMIGIIRWTLYDGTPETLPEEGRAVLVTGRGSVSHLTEGKKWSNAGEYDDEFGKLTARCPNVGEI